MKHLLYFIILFPFFSFSQSTLNWHHLDPETDNVLGIGTIRAYELLNSKISHTVVVAVIDNGAEITHEDLQGNIWVNEDEIPDNGIDDDKNGYIDDINGWNFLGNGKGENLKYETTGLARFYKHLNEKFQGKSEASIAKEDLDEFHKYQKVIIEYETATNKAEEQLLLFNNIITNHKKSDESLTKYFKTSDYSIEDIIEINSTNNEVLDAKVYMLKLYENRLTLKKLEKQISNIQMELDTRLNPNFNNRIKIVGDNPDDLSDSIYGNNKIDARGPYHGTGVASIIGALDNDIGVTGVAQNVKLMILRIVPNGDERDKDIALAFRYAIRNGANIINCSFGKKYSMHPEFVYAVMQEAEKADVLIVHGAGNDGVNTDILSIYPTGIYPDKSKAKNWINVGATKSADDKNLVAFFSNYGVKSVDIFAPGFNINSCVLNNRYGLSSGTSNACPVVTGLAATLKSYYPYLTAVQLKEIINTSAYIPKTKKVILPGEDKKKQKFAKLSMSGGIANLYRAVLLVEKEYLKYE